jgi:hypothetical protein
MSWIFTWALVVGCWLLGVHSLILSFSLPLTDSVLYIYRTQNNEDSPIGVPCIAFGYAVASRAQGHFTILIA